MSKNGVEDKLPIYKLKTKELMLGYV